MPKGLHCTVWVSRNFLLLRMPTVANAHNATATRKNVSKSCNQTQGMTYMQYLAQYLSTEVQKYRRAPLVQPQLQDNTACVSSSNTACHVSLAGMSTMGIGHHQATKHNRLADIV